MPSPRLLKLWEQDQGKYHACVMKYWFAVSDDTPFGSEGLQDGIVWKEDDVTD